MYMFQTGLVAVVVTDWLSCKIVVAMCTIGLFQGQEQKINVVLYGSKILYKKQIKTTK